MWYQVLLQRGRCGVARYLITFVIVQAVTQSVYSLMLGIFRGGLVESADGRKDDSIVSILLTFLMNFVNRCLGLLSFFDMFFNPICDYPIDLIYIFDSTMWRLETRVICDALPPAKSENSSHDSWRIG